MNTSNYLLNVKNSSSAKYEELKKRLEDTYGGKPEFQNICVFACGSMGRSDMTETSDLDLFFVDDSPEEQPLTDLNKHIFFAELYKINNELKYQKPSKEGMFWIFTCKEDLLDIGSRGEDYKNSFTARLLLMLESKPLFNENLYNKLITETVDRYFTDYEKVKEPFLPLFLMNDVLRYWYTLTLNYEFRRDEKDDEYHKNWKRLKLKYARLLTCFSLYLCLFKKNITREHVISCIKMTPLERLTKITEWYSDTTPIVKKIEKEYEWYLKLRKEKPDWWSKGNNKTNAWKHADRFHKYMIRELMKQVATTNPKLSEKTELNILG